MKVLMFGWEFPPHISGGLGTACYGLTRGLSELEDVEVTFVVPKAFGDEDQSQMKLIGANQVPIVQKQIDFEEAGKSMDYIEVDSLVVPYMNEEEFWTAKSKKLSGKPRFIKTGDGHTIEFSGTYGANLIQEIKNYAFVAELIAGREDFDIIHAHDWLAYPAGIAAKRVSGKPLLVHVHATDFDRSGGSVNPTVYSIEREGMEVADQIITVSNFTRDTVIQKYGINPKKVETVYNAVEPVGKEENTLPQKGFNEKIVSFLGRITMQKGPEYFIEAASMVLRKMDNVRFVMAGSGDMHDAMIARIADLGIADRFHFTGFLKGSEISKLFKMTDVFVMPSVSEPFGIVPLEAMQFNVPVIISNQSGVSEVLEHAVKVDFWDTFALADSIYGILNYPSLAEHFKQEGKTEVDGLLWVNSAREVKKVYDTLIH